MKNLKSVFQKKYLFIALPILILIGVVVWIILTSKIDHNQKVIDETLQHKNIDFEWWNTSYTFRRNFTIENVSTLDLISKACFSFEIDLQRSEYNFSENENFKIISYDHHNYTEFDTLSRALTDNSYQICFSLESEDSLAVSDGEYYIYYGNTDENNIVQNDEIATAESVLEVMIANEQKVPVFASGNRKWVLTKTRKFNQYSKIVYSLEIADEFSYESKPTYRIEGTDIKGSFAQNEGELLQKEIDLSDLPAGIYTIISEIKDYKKNLWVSNPIKIYVSAPLYIAYTMDWEGYDTPDTTIALMEELSGNYSVPITHFWNPRIYLDSVLNQERADYLTNWVMKREKKGDEIGLHLHMHYDMLEKAGITPQKKPRWDSTRPDIGSDVPFYVYSYDESVKLLNWALGIFEDNGLGKPISFRGGGWMMDIDNLKAIETAGFLIDSSGRTKFSLGTEKYLEEEIQPQTNQESELEELQESQESIQDSFVQQEVENEKEIIPVQIEYEVEGFWDLGITTYPYQINSSNQNSSLPPYLAVWEFPNNGADSWRFGAEEMISRFTKNYSTGVLHKPQVVTYLSHPHAFGVDIKRLEPLFDHIKEYNISDDKGPVVYVTLKDAYGEFVY